MKQWRQDSCMGALDLAWRFTVKFVQYFWLITTHTLPEALIIRQGYCWFSWTFGLIRCHLYLQGKCWKLPQRLPATPHNKAFEYNERTLLLTTTESKASKAWRGDKCLTVRSYREWTLSLCLWRWSYRFSVIKGWPEGCDRRGGGLQGTKITCPLLWTELRANTSVEGEMSLTWSSVLLSWLLLYSILQSNIRANTTNLSWCLSQSNFISLMYINLYQCHFQLSALRQFL